MTMVDDSDKADVLGRAGLPGNAIAAWRTNDDALTGDYRRDAEDFSRQWRIGAEMLAFLPANRGGPKAEAAAAATILAARPRGAAKKSGHLRRDDLPPSDRRLSKIRNGSSIWSAMPRRSCRGSCPTRRCFAARRTCRSATRMAPRSTRVCCCPTRSRMPPAARICATPCCCHGRKRRNKADILRKPASSHSKVQRWNAAARRQSSPCAIHVFSMPKMRPARRSGNRNRRRHPRCRNRHRRLARRHRRACKIPRPPPVFRGHQSDAPLSRQDFLCLVHQARHGAGSTNCSAAWRGRMLSPDEVAGGTIEKPWIGVCRRFRHRRRLPALFDARFRAGGERCLFDAAGAQGRHHSGRRQSAAMAFHRRSHRPAGHFVWTAARLRYAGEPLICDEIAPPASIDAALENVIDGFTSSGVVSIAGNRRAVRVGQEPLDTSDAIWRSMRANRLIAISARR